jgi:hypothetical protein
MENFTESNNKVVELRNLLEQSGIDTSTWGQGPTKTIEQLQKEIDEGEAVLIKTDSGEVVRNISLACVDVYYKNEDGKIFFLREDKQVYQNGSERKRTLKSSVTEKMKSEENSLDAAKRGLMEELGISGDLNLEHLEKVEDEEEIVSAYPGLKSKRIKDIFRVNLDETQFLPEGYKEVQEDKTTYFNWEEIQS